MKSEDKKETVKPEAVGTFGGCRKGPAFRIASAADVFAPAVSGPERMKILRKRQKAREAIRRHREELGL